MGKCGCVRRLISYRLPCPQKLSQLYYTCGSPTAVRHFTSFPSVRALPACVRCVVFAGLFGLITKAKYGRTINTPQTGRQQVSAAGAAGAAKDWKMGNASAEAAMTAAGSAAGDGPGATEEAVAGLAEIVRPPRPADWGEAMDLDGLSTAAGALRHLGQPRMGQRQKQF